MDLKTMKLKKIMIFLSIPVFIALYFAENIKGYYRFKHFCNTKGSLTIYKKIEPHVGWGAEDKWEAETIVSLKGVAFVRFPDKKGKYFDMQYVSGSRDYRDSAETKDADFQKKIQYQYEVATTAVPNELRLSRQSRQIWNANRTELVIEHNSFDYSQYERRKTFLAAPSNVRCTRYKREQFSEIFK